MGLKSTNRIRVELDGILRERKCEEIALDVPVASFDDMVAALPDIIRKVGEKHDLRKYEITGINKAGAQTVFTARGNVPIFGDGREHEITVTGLDEADAELTARLQFARADRGLRRKVDFSKPTAVAGEIEGYSVNGMDPTPCDNTVIVTVSDGAVERDVEVSCFGPVDNYIQMQRHAEEAIRIAESGSGAKAVGIRKPGERMEFEVRADHYHDHIGHGSWEGTVLAVDEKDAEFQARILMSRDKLGPDADIAALITDGQGHRIASLKHEPAVTDDAVRESLMALAAEALAAGHAGPAMDKVLENFRALGIDVEASQTLGM